MTARRGAPASAPNSSGKDERMVPEDGKEATRTFEPTEREWDSQEVIGPQDPAARKNGGRGTGERLARSAEKLHDGMNREGSATTVGGCGQTTVARRSEAVTLGGRR